MADTKQNASTSHRATGRQHRPIRTRRSPRGRGTVGPAHGGANEAVMAMLDQIGRVENIPKYLGMVKDNPVISG